MKEFLWLVGFQPPLHPWSIRFCDALLFIVFMINIRPLNKNSNDIERYNSRLSFNLSTVTWTVSNTRTYVVRVQLCKTHQILSCATCHAHQIVWQDNSAIKSQSIEISSISALYHWLKPQSDEVVGGGEGGKSVYTERTPDDKFQKVPHTKARRFKIQPRLEPAL